MALGWHWDGIGMALVTKERLEHRSPYRKPEAPKPAFAPAPRKSISGKIPGLSKTVSKQPAAKDQLLNRKINNIYSSISQVIVNHKDNFFRDVFATLPPFFLEHIYAKDKKYFVRYFLKPALNIEEGKFEVVKIKPEILKTNIREVPAGYIIKRNIERGMLNVKEYKVYLEKSRTLFRDFLAAFSSEHDDNVRYFQFVERIKKLVSELIKKQQLYLEKQVRAYLESSGFQKFFYPHNNRESKSIFYKPVYHNQRTILHSHEEKIGEVSAGSNGKPAHFEVVIVNYEYLIHKDMFKKDSGEKPLEISELIYLSRVDTFSDVKGLEKKLAYLQNRKYKEEKKQFTLERKKRYFHYPWLPGLLGFCGMFFLLSLAAYRLNAALDSGWGQGLPYWFPDLLASVYSRLREALVVFFASPRVGDWQSAVDFLNRIWIAMLQGLAVVTGFTLLYKGIRTLFALGSYLLFKLKFGIVKNAFRKYEQRDINGFFNLHNAIKFITKFNRKHKDIDELIKKS